MRKSVRILLGLCGLLIMAVVVAAASTIDIHAAGAAVVENSKFLALAPVAIVTSTITPDIIQDLKVKFGHIKIITVVAEVAELDGSGKEITPAEQYQFLVRRPDKGLIKMLLPLAKEGKLDEFADKAVKNLVVGGDLNALDDGIVFMGVVAQLQNMISPASSFLAKA